MENKKSLLIGWKWIIGLFLIMILMLFMIGLVDLVKVEFFDPADAMIENMTFVEENNNSDSVYVQKQQEIDNVIGEVTLPWNFVLIFVTGILVLVSFVDAVRQPKQSPVRLILGTTAGLIFLVYFVHLFIIQIITYFEIQVIGKLFGDLINQYVPFYNILFDNWQWVVYWILSINILNFLLGGQKEEETL